MAKRPRLCLVTSQPDPVEHRDGRRSRRRGEDGRARAVPPQQHAYAKNLAPKSEGQAAFMDAIDAHDVVIGIGPAGTGKTFIAIVKAVESWRRGEVRKIVLVRPAVEAGEKLGFLPGGPAEKMDPYMRPLFDALLSRMSGQQLSALMAEKVIEIAPIGFMRGRTLSDSFIVVDEAQNATGPQLKMLLTRLGMGSKMVVSGDPDQCDLGEGSGALEDVARRIDGRLRGACVVRMREGDVVRHPLVRALLPLLAA